jgi:hypothetical protein
MTKLFLSLLLLVFTTTCLAQNDSIQNLYFVKKNREVVFGKTDYQPGKNAFYIYRNCVYDLVLKNKKEISVHVTDIKDNAIYYTPYMNDPASASDTGIAVLYPANIKRIKMIGDRTFGLYGGFSLRKCRYHFEKSDTAKFFRHYIDTVYSADSSRATFYDIVPYLTMQGIDHLYKQCGKTYYYEGIGEPECKDTVKKSKPPIVKKWVWFTPSNANKISGLNLSAQVLQARDEQLAIHGVNLSADLLSIFAGCYLLFGLNAGNTLINMPDTINRSEINTRINGLSLSGGGLICDALMKGVSINGGICTAIQANGLVITGSQNLTNEFNGVVVSGLRNRAIKGRGVQVGLLNICKHLKGVQFGLWNVNSKRKLPLINWSF